MTGLVVVQHISRLVESGYVVNMKKACGSLLLVGKQIELPLSQVGPFSRRQEH